MYGQWRLNSTISVGVITVTIAELTFFGLSLVSSAGNGSRFPLESITGQLNRRQITSNMAESWFILAAGLADPDPVLASTRVWL